MIENYFGVKNVITKVLHNNPLNRTRQQSMMENEFGVKNVITKVLQNDPLNHTWQPSIMGNEFGVKNVITKLQQKCLKLPREGEETGHCKVKHEPFGRNLIQEINMFDKYLHLFVFGPFHNSYIIINTKCPDGLGSKCCVRNTSEKS